jgi:two-component system chemotaxis response regulator CheY
MTFNRTVMLADDQAACREQLREIFRYLGCMIVAESRNTDDTLAKFEKLEPDVVVVDVTLLGSHDALVAIRQMWRQNPLVTILATGTASQSSIVMEALSMGAVDFFLKPFNFKSVRNCLERNL